MSAKPTSGPWSIGTANGYNANTIYDGSDSSVAMVYGISMHTSKEEVEQSPMCAQGIANARLIVAAPELLEALQELLSEVDAMTLLAGWAGNGGRGKARAAIAKATGEAK